ncbi:hypothetical protein PPYR_14482 [Photinus pyralis]|uniref:Lipase domain-containing protein n=1 Tax=Photinus pyralis TaxID=7054 RepID=A0A1Y1MUV2_PHOPY|nr:pancreatic lipase-related protein 2-like isoform X2 [Photinus pyralis]KAB0792523.1 hypothetical protein PPYR_14482 [Photinus pyralis]
MMGILTTSLIILNGLLVATLMFFVTLSKPETNFESSTALSKPILDLNKLKETISNFNWSEYFEVGRGNPQTTPVQKPTTAVNETYLDPYGPNVQFILFTRDGLPYNLKLDAHENFVKSNFNYSNPTKIIIHGFISSIRETVFQINKDAYLETGDYNVIGMDWSVLCEFEYFTAMRGAQIAGSHLGAFLRYLIQEGVGYENIHLIGHSLGAHVAAMGADKVQGGKIHRITGLDPAGPGYNDVPMSYRLDPSDAHLVDVIHTNMRLLSLSHPQGHLDFYPNGGRFQPGCPELADIWTVTDSLECNHGRAYHYFAETIRNKGAFKSYRCAHVNVSNLDYCVIQTEVYMGQEETYEVIDCSTNKIKANIATKPDNWQAAVKKCTSANISWYGSYYLRTRALPPYSFA